MFVLPIVAALAALGACCAVALRAHRALGQWHAADGHQFDLLVGDFAQAREAVRYTWFVVHRPRLVPRPLKGRF